MARTGWLGRNGAVGREEACRRVESSGRGSERENREMRESERDG